MEKRQKFQRIFMIFNNEDAGYEAGGNPSGYLKIEVRDGRGKLYATVQNLRVLQGGYMYVVYILAEDKERIVPVRIGALPVANGKGDIKWEFDSYSVADTELGIDRFGAAILLVEAENMMDGKIICPLAAYRDKKIDWRNAFKRAYLSENLVDSAEKEEEKVEGKEEKREEKEEEKKEEKGAVREEEKGEAEKREKEKGEEEKGKEQAEETREETEIAESNRQDKEEAKIEKEDENSTYKAAPDDRDIEIQTASNTEDGGQAAGETVGNNVCRPQKEGDVSGVHNMEFNPCAGCINNPDKNMAAQAEEYERRNLLEKLRASFNRSFEKYNPFMSKRKDYEWWKVSSPVHLNNIMYQYGIKTPLLFNPVVMMSHFKYRHLIVGIYTDKTKDIEYLVCGIPGVYNVDERPFGELCRWVQLEGSRPRYGAFGYWLVFIDPESGKLLARNT
ncbi:MAG TPA: hypothetical protein GXX14_04070 [Clostridiaceae bacterium]|nr:hypothetical protein [Clostridiaceae bacterium]